MPHHFEPFPEEPESQPSESRRGVPPRKFVGAGLLDPPGGPPSQRVEDAPLPRTFFIPPALAWTLLLLLLAGVLATLFVSIR